MEGKLFSVLIALHTHGQLKCIPFASYTSEFVILDFSCGVASRYAIPYTHSLCISIDGTTMVIPRCLALCNMKLSRYTCHANAAADRLTSKNAIQTLEGLSIAHAFIR